MQCPLNTKLKLFQKKNLPKKEIHHELLLQTSYIKLFNASYLRDLVISWVGILRVFHVSKIINWRQKYNISNYFFSDATCCGCQSRQGDPRRPRCSSKPFGLAHLRDRLAWRRGWRAPGCGSSPAQCEDEPHDEQTHDDVRVSASEQLWSGRILCASFRCAALQPGERFSTCGDEPDLIFRVLVSDQSPRKIFSI